MGRRRRRRGRGGPSADPQDASEKFEPPIARITELPPDVVSAREEAKRQQDWLEDQLQPRIDGHLLACQQVLDELIAAHARISETFDFGLGGRTRWTAIWEMAGRCLGLANSLVPQLRGGFASETVPTLRAIHEAGQLLTVLTGPGEEKLLRRWLDDTDYIKASQARQAEVRINKPAVEFLRAEGIELAADPTELGSKVYGVLSKPAHNMRSGFLESVSAQLRQFSYGPHPDPTQRAVHVEFGRQLIEEITMRIGVSLAVRFLGNDYYRDTVMAKLVASLRAVAETMPIDPRTLAQLRAEAASL